MNSDKDKEFEKNMKEFMQLLKKMIRNLPAQGTLGPKTIPWKDGDGNGMNMNVYFFSFFPLSADDFDELEDIYESYLERDSDEKVDFSTDLSHADLEFLRRHGLRF